LNSIREVCRRQPWCMEEDLLGDLIEYRKSRDKGVITAARSLLQLYRDVNPAMLKRRERGKLASMGLASGSRALPFGQAPTSTGIEGLDVSTTCSYLIQLPNATMVSFLKSILNV